MRTTILRAEIDLSRMSQPRLMLALTGSGAATGTFLLLNPLYGLADERLELVVAGTVPGLLFGLALALGLKLGMARGVALAAVTTGVGLFLGGTAVLDGTLVDGEHVALIGPALGAYLLARATAYVLDGRIRFAGIVALIGGALGAGILALWLSAETSLHEGPTAEEALVAVGGAAVWHAAVGATILYALVNADPGQK